MTSVVAAPMRSDSARTSPAMTEKPRPALPARAASIAALSEQANHENTHK